MLSRVANSIFWMNRYIERTENYARYTSVNFNLSLDSSLEQWEPLVIATADNYTYFQHYQTANRRDIFYFVSFDERNPNSILNSVASARENARTIRESISKEMWEYLNLFYWQVREASATSPQWETAQYQNFFGQVKTHVLQFYGIVDSTITRNEGWHFGRLGRLLERADKTTRFLDISYFTLSQEGASNNPSLDMLQWTAVLKSVSAFNMFRQEYRELSPSNIVEFLLLDKDFPRSVRHCIRQAELSLYEISGSNVVNGYSNHAEKLLTKLRHDIEFTEVSDIQEIGLHKFLDTFQQRNNAVGEAIFKTYFDLKPVVSAMNEQ
jgi:uncharacterized alpha-E superfamily protein